ncbi:MAG: hypothetical protein ACRDHY_09460 [Anaerolineales bacterium]
MALQEAELIDAALKLLASRLPPGWTVERVQGQGAGTGEGDALFAFNTQPGMGMGSAIVDARRNFGPADVDRLLGGLTRRLREAAGPRPILLVSDYLSPRTRELLAKEDISYLDLTGNIRLVMQSPPVFVEVAGAGRRPPATTTRRSAGLAGAKAGSAVRFLAEVVPPYGVNDIEEATGISRGYVSRVLDRLADEALIRREPRGPVEAVDWPAMLRRRGESVDLFRVNTARTYVSPNGARAVFEALPRSAVADGLVVTGSFAAVRKAPVAGPALLVMYVVPSGGVPKFDRAATELGLRPTDEASDVVLLLPSNERVVEDPWIEEGVRLVNLPQLAVDCLGGSGRMPAEGEALIDWMQANTEEWQLPSLAAYLEQRS